MSTRRADPDAPLSQERYMSSLEFVELQGINGMAVAKKCALLPSPAKRQLLWFIQGLSLLNGGCKTLAEELLKMFPDRVGTNTMHKLGMRKGQRYTGKAAVEIEEELDYSGDCTAALLRREFAPRALLDESWEDAPAPARADYGPPVPCESLYARCLEAAKATLPDFLTELCINPALRFQAPGESDCNHSHWSSAQVVYFQDIIGALFEYKRRYEERAKADFCQTAISRQIWGQLDDALKTKTMIVIDGLEGRGKTEAVRAWCNCHLGAARFVSLDGTSTKTAQFRELARALGVGHGNSRKALEMQTGVRDVLQTAQLMVVIDEAHFFFNQSLRLSSRPEMLDWIDTALCNPPLPVALVTTPQFLVCMERAVGQVGWNYRQFKRRCKRYVRLPPESAPEDIEAIARKLLPGADKATIKQIMAYEALSKRDLSAVGDVVREAKLLAEEDGARKVTFEHVKRAIYEVLLASDVAWAEMEKRLQQRKLGRKASRNVPAIAPEAAQEPSETQEREILPRLSRGVTSGNRIRFQEPATALAGAPGLTDLTAG
jgi:hypothetical protein